MLLQWPSEVIQLFMAAGSNETGIGYAFRQGSPFGAYWTETFGRR
jgi:uncharacterized protein YkwD